MSIFQFKTDKGYDFGEVASALQKCIRRGMEEDAMYWAIELESRFPDYLWQRLQIISIEDIGIADMQTVLYVSEMRDLYEEIRRGGKGRSYRMALGNAILSMCRAKKSRIGDEFQIVCYGRHEGERIEIPDFALDVHTKQGKKMGRGPEHFWTEGVILENEDRKIRNPYSEKARAIRCSGKVVKEKEGPEEMELF
jgi:replication-associated recombination protein RarA